MNLPQVLSNRQFKGIAAITAFVAVIYIIFNIFTIGGDQFIFNLNSSFSLPLAIINIFVAFNIWQMMSEENRNRFLWIGLIAGWLLWAFAEFFWTVYALLGKEVPYPSLADFFWALGYIPMAAGLIIRIKTMPIKPNATQRTFIFSISVITFFITLFLIIIPVLQNFDSELLIESILSLIYPIFDLILVTIVWRMFFTYEEGDYGFGWRLLTFGFIFNAASDFTFIFADWNDLYYPDMQANWISRLLVDTPYTLSYMFWFLGGYALSIARQKEPLPSEQPISKVRVVRTYGHILVYTKNDDTVLDVSPNFGLLLEDEGIIGASFAQALTISEQNARTVLDKIRLDGKIADYPIQIRTRSGATQEVRMSGLAINNPQKGYLGSNLLLRTRVKDKSFDDLLDSSSQAMVRYLLEKSGSNNKSEVAQFIGDYYFAYIRSLLTAADQQGGNAMVEALLQKLSETAQEHNWQIKFSPQTAFESAAYPAEVLREALPILVETAKKFVADITDPLLVEARMNEVSLQFSETVRRDIERYTKADNENE